MPMPLANPNPDDTSTMERLCCPMRQHTLTAAGSLQGTRQSKKQEQQKACYSHVSEPKPESWVQSGLKAAAGVQDPVAPLPCMRTTASQLSVEGTAVNLELVHYWN